MNIHNISTESPANMEITWGHCPRVPKENGGLHGMMGLWGHWEFGTMGFLDHGTLEPWYFWTRELYALVLEKKDYIVTFICLNSVYIM